MHVLQTKPRELEPVTGSAVAKALLSGRPVPVAVTGLATDDIERVWQGLRDFATRYTPEEQKRWELVISRPGVREGRVDDGVIRKDKLDHKIYLHYRPDLVDHLFTERGIELTTEEEDWFASCDTIRTACLGALMEVARSLDEQYPDHNFAGRLLMNQISTVLRVLYYDPTPGRIAQVHTDIDAISCHIGQSHPGLFYIEDGEQVFFEDLPDGMAYLFPGAQLSHLTDGFVTGLQHGVENIGNVMEPRWAVVCFGYF